MRLIFIILLIGLFKADAQMVINASAPYRPLLTGVLLDNYPNAAAGYSLRKLRTAYTGAAIRVRKDTTGQPEQDIFFTASGDLDTAALKSFLNARSGFIVTWMDQSGNGRNASQSTQSLQPQIANAGVIIREINNLPTVSYSSATRLNIDTLLADQFEGVNQQLSVFSITRQPVLTGGRTILSFSGNELTGSSNDLFLFGSSSNLLQGFLRIRTTINTDKIVNSSPNTMSINTNYIVSWIKTSENGTVYLNNNAGTSASQTNIALTLRHATIGGSIRGSDNLFADGFQGRISEIIIWNTDQTSNRIAIMNNLNSYYAIY